MIEKRLLKLDSKFVEFLVYVNFEKVQKNYQCLERKWRLLNAKFGSEKYLDKLKQNSENLRFLKIFWLGNLHSPDDV